MSSLDAVARTPRPAMKTIGLWVVVVLLAGFVVFAALREAAKGNAAANPTMPAVEPTAHHRAALSAEDERFAQELSNIHGAVRTAALRMTFAGLSYKMGDGDRASVATKVKPLTDVFSAAADALRALDTPASMRETRERYANGLRLYLDASREMVKVAQDGNDSHLLDAQMLSEQASGILLQVGDQLWPGEIKPN